ncbi:MAG: TolC family protein [Bryobacteraceae bacterium]
MQKLRLITGFLCLTGLLFAGDSFTTGDILTNEPYFPAAGYFRKHFAPPPTEVDLEPPVRLGDYAVNGKLELSLRAYLDLVMANNNDITIQKLSVEVPRDAITRAFSAFDPLATAQFTDTRSQTPASSALTGAATLNQLTQPLNFGVTQELPTGAQYNVNFSGQKLSTNSSFATFNPTYSEGLNFTLSQPLLRGRGVYINRLPIIIARSRFRSAEWSLKDGVIQLVQNAEMAYWNMIGARENLRVAQESLKLSDTALQRAKKELSLGAASPLDIFQPEQNYANSQIQVTQAGNNLVQAQDALRRQMGADLDPRYRNMPIVLTESLTPPVVGALDRNELVQQALSTRQDLQSYVEAVNGDDLVIREANDALRPSLNLTAQYSGFGRGGNFFNKQNIFNGDGTTSTIVNVVPGGVTDALGQLFGFGYPTYGLGLTFSLPIRDRRASANLADAVVAKRLDSLHVRVTQENVRLQVLQSVTQIENSQATLALAKVARDLAAQRVDAEQKKYDLGTSTIFFVLAAQGDLTTAESVLVSDTINYHVNLLNLDRVTGELLSKRGITLQ